MPVCVRCQGRATTMLTYRHADATAYLDDVQGHEQRHDGILLCAEHAGRFSAPLGWETIDRRVTMPTEVLDRRLD